MADDELAWWTASDLVAAYRSRQVSPVEATRAALGRIEQDNPLLHAFCLVDADRALTDAEAARRRWHAREPLGPLDGVPVSIKDLYLTAGWPTRRGSRRIDPDQSWTVDSPPAARLRESGAVLLGKTTTSEFGWKAVTDNLIDGATANPHDPGRTAGGSSGGSGAALAAGMGALSVATDAAGSTRIPAAFCGVVGLKPTYGRIPLYPASDLGTLGCGGPMARTVGDVALLLDVLCGSDDRDPNALPPPAANYRDQLRPDVRGVRAAYSPTLGYAAPDPDVVRVVDAAVAALAGQGLRVEPADPPFADPLADFTVLWAAGMSRLLDSQLGGSTDGIDPGLAALLDAGRKYPVGEYLAARRAGLDIGTTMGEFHRRYDVLLTPTVPVPAFPLGSDVPPGSPARSWLEWTPYTLPFSMSQQPALSVPVGRTPGGLPVGLQIVGPRHAEALVLSVGAALEAALTRG